MVTARLAVGSVSTLALGALLLGSVPYWMHRSAAGAHATPWGAISSLSAGAAANSAADEDRAQLLKLASLKTASTDTAAAQPSPAPVEAVATPTPEANVQQSDAAPAISQALDATAAPADASSQPAMQQMASAEPASSSDPMNDASAAKSNRVNINTASSEALDHLPGAGRIGHAIVSHRPYRNTKDLVSRRVLRTSDYQKIQSHISAD